MQAVSVDQFNRCVLSVYTR